MPAWIRLCWDRYDELAKHFWHCGHLNADGLKNTKQTSVKCIRGNKWSWHELQISLKIWEIIRQIARPSRLTLTSKTHNSNLRDQRFRNKYVMQIYYLWWSQNFIALISWTVQYQSILSHNVPTSSEQMNNRHNNNSFPFKLCLQKNIEMRIPFYSFYTFHELKATNKMVDNHEISKIFHLLLVRSIILD